MLFGTHNPGPSMDRCDDLLLSNVVFVVLMLPVSLVYS